MQMGDTADGRRKPPSQISSTLKWFLLSFCMLFWIFGGVFIGIGAWAVLQKTGYKDISDFVTDPAIVLIAVGVWMFLINFIGTVGALRENICCLETYKYVLVAILVVEIIGGLLAFAFWPETKKLIDTKIQVAIEKYTSNVDLRNLIDRVQYEFKCCGSTAIDDWNRNPYFNCTKPQITIQACGVPWSCCRRQFQRNKQCGYGLRKGRLRLQLADTIYITPCMDGVLQFFKDNLMAIAGAAVAFTFPIIAGIFMSHIFVHQIRKQIDSWDDPKVYL